MDLDQVAQKDGEAEYQGEDANPLRESMWCHLALEEALHLLDVDQFGLDDMDSRILKAIIEKFGGGPVGVGTIAAAVGEDVETLEEVYEPFLVQNGFLQRTPRGRVATAQAYRHFGFNPPAQNGGAQQPTLF